MMRVVVSSQEGIIPTSDRKIELHCKENSMKSITRLHISSNEIENPAKILHCLSPALEILQISETPIGELETNAFSRFQNLSFLRLIDVKLRNFDAKVLENITQIVSLQIICLIHS